MEVRWRPAVDYDTDTADVDAAIYFKDSYTVTRAGAVSSEKERLD